MTAPLLDDFAMADLVALSAANLVHRADAQGTEDGGRTWTVLQHGSDLPCRLSKPSPSDIGSVAETDAVAASRWVLALEAGSPFAAARIRFIVTGSEHGTAFTRIVFSIGALTPLAQTAEARVLCTESQLAAFGGS